MRRKTVDIVGNARRIIGLGFLVVIYGESDLLSCCRAVFFITALTNIDHGTCCRVSCCAFGD